MLSGTGSNKLVKHVDYLEESQNKCSTQRGHPAIFSRPFSSYQHHCYLRTMRLQVSHFEKNCLQMIVSPQNELQ